MLWCWFQQPKQCASFPAHRSKIPPQVPLTKDGGAAGGSAVGRLAHGLPVFRVTQQCIRCATKEAAGERLAQRLQRRHPPTT